MIPLRLLLGIFEAGFVAEVVYYPEHALIIEC